LTTVHLPPSGDNKRRTVLIGIAVTASYVVAARLGFQLAFVAEQVTTVWAPTGIALAAFLLWGPRLWPAVWLGAFLANAATTAPLWTAFLIATGNTLEALTAIWLIRRLCRFDITFHRVADVVVFTIVGGGLCTTMSATVGAATLSAAAVVGWERFPAIWFDWWLGDALGALVVAPVIVTAVVQRSWSRRVVVNAALFVAVAILVTQVIFGQVFGFAAHPLEFFVFPVVIAAAVRGGPQMTSFVVLSASLVAIAHTVRGAGPFAGPEVHQSLILLQAFMGVLAVTGLLLAAAIAEREVSRQRERQAAAVIGEREQMLRLAQRAGGVATFEWDFRNQIARCSGEFFEIFGLPAQDGTMTGDRWGQYVHPDDRERMATHLARALAGADTPSADYRIVRSDGETRWLSYAGQLRQTTDGDRMLGIVVDITERKRLEAQLRRHAEQVERMLDSHVETEAALRESRDVLALAMRGGSMGAWSRNVATNEVWWSRELEELFGVTPGAFNRTEAGFFEFVHSDDHAAVRQAVDAAVDNRTDYVIEFRFRHASGEWRWMEGRGRAVYAENGAPLTLYGIGIDITARKHSEIALQAAKDAAETANQLKDQFLATLSHELRTPLNAILGYARMLRTNTIAPEKRDRAIDVIERNARAQSQLVEDLLDMSRITTGRIRLDPEPVPVAAVLREALEGVKPAAEAKGLVLAVDADPFAGPVRADVTRLQQVFWNLLTNAVKFTPPGGRVTAALRRDDAHVIVTVNDTGVGISPEFLPFVFEPFRQADARLGRDHGGLGLGLAISKQLVELHGGTIHADSGGLGQGATFTIRLPVQIGTAVSDAALDQDEQIPAAPISLRGLDIVLADDEEDTLAMFRDALDAAGAQVRAVTTADAAIREIERLRPDLLVTDLGLPGMDGFELLRTIRSGAAASGLPAVAVTAYARSDDRSRAIAAGFQGYIAKPVDPAALVATIAAALQSAD
jgi:PAS domain S-box-containing protein